ncbi:unnamed protein product [Lasius platythorax]|uniref:Uncharacterized protein n=1 Tax=Lasius platythorax TaxID=488582 RepID=A0AAV2NNY0_9HYME
MNNSNKDEIRDHRLKRAAYKKKAANKIFDENENVSEKKIKQDIQARRKKSATSSSDEEDTKSGSKYSKVDENLTETKRSTRKRKLNETVVIQKVSSKKNTQSKKKSIRTNLQPNVQTAQCNDYNELITDDESFHIKHNNKMKRLLSTSSEDDVPEQRVYSKPNYVDVVPRITRSQTVAEREKD